MFKIIPVIDLLNGVVVHAKHGDRQHYQPIQSQLTNSSQPLDIVKALMDVYHFNTLYIADLNAIQQFKHSHQDIISSIIAHYPKLNLWLDSGVHHTDDFNQFKAPQIKPIIGSENIDSIAHYERLTHNNRRANHLSIDYLINGYKGPRELLSNPAYWPEHVIAMTLQQVGSNSGIQTETLSQLLTLRQHQHIYAAGGIRNSHDLVALSEMKASGVLMASALHQQQIKHVDIALHSLD